MYSGYHEKKNFSFYTLSILSYALQELESNEGINFGMINLGEKLLINDVKDLLFVLCRSLTETYDYDMKQLEYIPSTMHNHVDALFKEDPFIVGNEVKLSHFKVLFDVFICFLINYSILALIK